MKVVLIFLVLSTAIAMGQAKKSAFKRGDTNPGNNYPNPIFAGDYPDPSLLRDGDDYYIFIPHLPIILGY